MPRWREGQSLCEGIRLQTGTDQREGHVGSNSIKHCGPSDPAPPLRCLKCFIVQPAIAKHNSAVSPELECHNQCSLTRSMHFPDIGSLSVIRFGCTFDAVQLVYTPPPWIGWIRPGTKPTNCLVDLFLLRWGQFAV